MKKALLSVVLLATGICHAQNLVPNGDFEQYSGCPTWDNQLDSVLFWMNTSPHTPNSGTPDYFNACNNYYVHLPNNVYHGYQVPHSGNACAGLLMYTSAFGGNVREYIEAPLTTPLQPGSCYHFELYMNVPNHFAYTTDDIGVYFSDTAVTNVTNWAPLPFTPQIVNASGNSPDTVSWRLFSGTYMASGGEQFLIIGNFKNDFNTSITAVNPGGNPYAYFYIDDVSLSLCTGIGETPAPAIATLFPNPAEDQLSVSVTTGQPVQIRITDVTGKILLEKEFSGSTQIAMQDFAAGIYFYTLRNRSGILQQGKLIRK